MSFSSRLSQPQLSLNDSRDLGVRGFEVVDWTSHNAM